MHVNISHSSVEPLDRALTSVTKRKDHIMQNETFKEFIGALLFFGPMMALAFIAFVNEMTL